jgi:outer membrane receptor for ferrienterochelin and colicin
MRFFFSLSAICCFLTAGIAQKATLSGYLRELTSGENLIGANIYVKEDPTLGTTSNTYGYYSLTLPVGKYTIVYSYLGYDDVERAVDLRESTKLDIALSEGETLEEVVVTAEDADENVTNTQMGTVDVVTDQIKKLPALFGEVDVLKALQLLPGVLSAGEGNSGFYVRGGGPDQNLVLLDEAVVYNSGHLLGFFSVFNPDAIQNTTLIKGGMPANYGGRLSSVIDIQMKEGNRRRFQVDGGIGIVASRLTAQGPLRPDQSSFILTGRRTYVLDLAQPAINNTDFAGTNYYFYDFNAKVNHRFSDRDRIFLSGYFGRDVLRFQGAERDFSFDLPYGNTTGTLRWNHLFNDQLFFNLSAIYNEYDFGFGGGQGDFAIDVFSGVRDYNLKLDFDFFPAPQHSLKFGGQYTYHRLTPNVATATNGEAVFSNNLLPRFAHETGIYLQDDWKVSPRLRMNLGLRYSTFTQLGPYTSPFDETEYAKGEPVITYDGWEPRLSARYQLTAAASLKGGVSVTTQYLHLVSNSTSTLPADIWVPSTELVKPQRGVQYALGYFQNLRNNRYEASVEIYYKDLRNQIDYRENYVNNAADDLERQFVFGSGRAYGAEFYLNKSKGRLTGWLGYTWSRTERTFPDIENGRTFRAVYDRPTDISAVLSYELSPRWTFSSTFIYGSGQNFTPVRSLYVISGELIQEYGPRNSVRTPDYHRLDLSAVFTPKPDSAKRFTSSWSFSVYNVYNRRNPFFIYYDLEFNQGAGTAAATAFQVSLFPIIPSVTWNFSWKS